MICTQVVLDKCEKAAAGYATLTPCAPFYLATSRGNLSQNICFPPLVMFFRRRLQRSSRTTLCCVRSIRRTNISQKPREECNISLPELRFRSLVCLSGLESKSAKNPKNTNKQKDMLRSRRDDVGLAIFSFSRAVAWPCCMQARECSA